MTGQHSPLAPDVAVVGGGIAGVAAANAASCTGAATTLLGDGGSRLSGLLPAVHRSEVQVWGCFADLTLAVTSPARTYTLRPYAVIVATGSHEQPLHFPGSDLVGVTTSTALLSDLAEAGPVGGRRFAIIGDPWSVVPVQIAIEAAGGTVAAVTDGRVAIRAEGDGNVEAVSIGDVRYACDAIVIAVRQAASELARMAGATVRYRPWHGGWVPHVDENGMTTVSRLFVVGQAAGPCSPEAAAAQGRLAGLAAALMAGAGGADGVREARAGVVAAHRPSSSTLDTAGDGLGNQPRIICPCEGVAREAVRMAIGHGATTINDVKRRTRAGMGDCQGLKCTGAIANQIATLVDLPLADVPPMTARPPLRPLTLGQLAALDTAGSSEADVRPTR